MNIDNIGPELLQWLQGEVGRLQKIVEQRLSIGSSFNYNDKHARQSALKTLESQVCARFYKGPYETATHDDKHYIDANDERMAGLDPKNKGMDHNWRQHIDGVGAHVLSSLKSASSASSAEVSYKEPKFGLQDDYRHIQEVKKQDGTKELAFVVSDYQKLHNQLAAKVVSSSSSAKWKKSGLFGRNAPECEICKRKFNYFNPNNRRHHCRLCGKAVCQDCSPHTMQVSNPLTKKGGTGEAAKVRVCKSCIEEQRKALVYSQARPYVIYTNNDRPLVSRAQIVVRHGHGVVLQTRLAAYFQEFLGQNEAARGMVYSFKVFSSKMGKGRSDCAVIYFHEPLSSPNIINFFKSLNPGTNQNRSLEARTGYCAPLCVNTEVNLPGFFPMKSADDSVVAWGMPIPKTDVAQQVFSSDKNSFSSAGALMGLILGKAVVRYICEHLEDSRPLRSRRFKEEILTVISEILVELFPDGLPTASHLHLAYTAEGRRRGWSANISDQKKKRFFSQLPVTNYRTWDY